MTNNANGIQDKIMKPRTQIETRIKKPVNAKRLHVLQEQMESFKLS